MGLAVGLRATVRHVVTDADTAIQAGSGDVPVLATPRLLALAEAACVAALESHLDDGMTSVGTGVALEHRRASPVGTEIEVEAELTELAGRRLVFSFIARHAPPGAGGSPAGAAKSRAGAAKSPAGAGSGDPADGDPDENGDLVAGAGTVARSVVNRDQFLARAAGPAGRPGQTPVVERG